MNTFHKWNNPQMGRKIKNMKQHNSHWTESDSSRWNETIMISIPRKSNHFPSSILRSGSDKFFVVFSFFLNCQTRTVPNLDRPSTRNWRRKMRDIDAPLCIALTCQIQHKHTLTILSFLVGLRPAVLLIPSWYLFIYNFFLRKKKKPKLFLPKQNFLYFLNRPPPDGLARWSHQNP